MILATRFTFIVERSWKNMYFHLKWLDHLLLMTSYLVTIATDHHWTSLKKCARDERTATENVSYWCFILSEKTQKNLSGGGGGGASSPRHRLYVRGLRVAISSRCIYWLRNFGGKRPNSFWRKIIVRKFSINRFSCLDYVKRETTFFDHDTFFTLR